MIYAKESIPDNPEGILLEFVLEDSGEYYSANLSQNIKREMLFDAMECKVKYSFHAILKNEAYIGVRH